MLAKHWWVKSNYPDAKVVLWKVSGQSWFAAGRLSENLYMCIISIHSILGSSKSRGKDLLYYCCHPPFLPIASRVRLCHYSDDDTLISFTLLGKPADKKTCSQHFFIQLLHKSTLFENHPKCRIWDFNFSIFHHFWHFWLTFVYSKCKRSSLRSQCWMRLFLWFSNTVPRQK